MAEQRQLHAGDSIIAMLREITEEVLFPTSFILTHFADARLLVTLQHRRLSGHS